MYVCVCFVSSNGYTNELRTHSPCCEQHTAAPPTPPHSEQPTAAPPTPHTVSSPLLPHPLPTQRATHCHPGLPLTISDQPAVVLEALQQNLHQLWNVGTQAVWGHLEKGKGEGRGVAEMVNDVNNHFFLPIVLLPSPPSTSPPPHTHTHMHMNTDRKEAHV